MFISKRMSLNERLSRIQKKSVQSSFWRDFHRGKMNSGGGSTQISVVFPLRDSFFLLILVAIVSIEYMRNSCVFASDRKMIEK